MTKSLSLNAPCCSACGTTGRTCGCVSTPNPFAPDPLTYNQLIANAPVDEVLDLEAERERYDLAANEAPDEPGEDVLDLDYERTKYAK